MNPSSPRSRTLIPAVVALASLWMLPGCPPAYPKCDTDEQCREAEFCVNGMCQQCRGDDDCPDGHSCANGACEVGYCESASDCGEGQDCQNNVCVTVATAELPAPSEAGPGDCYIQSVYFDYDSSSVESGSRDQLSTNAACLKEKQINSVHLTGLTDPRGTEEYNMALGDRRARSAQKYLKSLGVEADITYSSMGEEMSTGQDDASWARDRRVDFK